MSKDRVIFAIDPGATGCTCVRFDQDPVPLIHRHKEVTEDALAETIRSTAEDCEVIVYLEKVGGYIGVPSTGGQMFPFGDGVGFFRGLCHAWRLRLERPTPQAWQKVYIEAGKSKGKERKKLLKEKAIEIFPRLKVVADNADALLLMDYAVHVEKFR